MTIVVGYSPSGQGRAALRAGVRYASRSAQDLVIVSHQYNDPEHGMSAADEDAVRAALAEVGGAVGEGAVRSSPTKDAGEFILAVADEVAADLLVIGLRRKPAIGKLNLGAAARRVVLGAPCPVLAVKDDYPAAGEGVTAGS